MISNAPIVVFVYNRPWHTEKIFEFLAKNPEARSSPLYIFADGPKTDSDQEKVQLVRNSLKKLNGFKTIEIIQREKNFGLANSIIAGVTDVLQRHDTAIILEDDIVVSQHFLSYMNRALSHYEKNERVASIHGWNFPLRGQLPDTFFLRGADCWGWATWRRAWNLFEADANKLLRGLIAEKLEHDFDLDGEYPYTQMLKDQIEGRVDSWAIRWHASMYIREMLTLHPGESLVQNIGFDNSGVHTGHLKFLETKLSLKSNFKFPEETRANNQMREAIKSYWRNSRRRALFSTIIQKGRNIFRKIFRP